MENRFIKEQYKAGQKHINYFAWGILIESLTGNEIQDQPKDWFNGNNLLLKSGATPLKEIQEFYRNSLKRILANKSCLKNIIDCFDEDQIKKFRNDDGSGYLNSPLTLEYLDFELFIKCLNNRFSIDDKKQLKEAFTYFTNLTYRKSKDQKIR